MNYCQLVIAGRLVRDPEVLTFQTKDGQESCVVRNTIACNNKYRDEERPLFLKFQAWGKIAETIGKYLKKGSPLFLVGELLQNNWVNKEGFQRHEIVLNVRIAKFLGRLTSPSIDKLRADKEAGPQAVQAEKESFEQDVERLGPPPDAESYTEDTPDGSPF